MYNWFECKVRYDKTLDTGMIKTVTEPYLVDAMSFTEAEARIIEEMRPYMSGEFTVSDIKRARFSDTFFNETGDRYYKAKLYFITLDEKSGSEKDGRQYARTGLRAERGGWIVEMEMKKTMVDYTIAAVNETAIMDVFRYQVEENSTTAE